MDRAAFLGNLLRDFVSHFTLRVQDKDIVFCTQGDLYQFFFRTHALAAARNAQPERVPVEQLRPVDVPPYPICRTEKQSV